MGFIGKLLSSVSSAVLILVGASAAGASTSTGQPEQKQQTPRTSLGEGELLSSFVLDTAGHYTEDSVEAAVHRMLSSISQDRVAELPGFVRGLRSLQLSPEAEVAAVESLISGLEEQSGSRLPAEQADAVIGQIFDQFAVPRQVARNDDHDPGGKFSDPSDFPGGSFAHSRGQKNGQPFQAS